MTNNAKKARNKGMTEVEKNANREWMNFMEQLVIDVAKKKKFFTADDVFRLLDQQINPPITHDQRAFGVVMSKSRKNKVCIKTGNTQESTRESLHSSPIDEWESLICEGSEEFQFNFVIARPWPNSNGLCIYTTYGSEVHQNRTLEDAENLLKYVNERSEEKHFIYRALFQKL